MLEAMSAHFGSKSAKTEKTVKTQKYHKLQVLPSNAPEATFGCRRRPPARTRPVAGTRIERANAQSAANRVWLVSDQVETTCGRASRALARPQDQKTRLERRQNEAPDLPLKTAKRSGTAAPNGPKQHPKKAPSWGRTRGAGSSLAELWQGPDQGHGISKAQTNAQTKAPKRFLGDNPCRPGGLGTAGLLFRPCPALVAQHNVPKPPTEPTKSRATTLAHPQANTTLGTAAASNPCQAPAPPGAGVGGYVYIYIYLFIVYVVIGSNVDLTNLSILFLLFEEMIVFRQAPVSA